MDSQAAHFVSTKQTLKFYGQKPYHACSHTCDPRERISRERKLPEVEKAAVEPSVIGRFAVMSHGAPQVSQPRADHDRIRCKE